MTRVQVADTPLARLLAEYAWSQRPPMSIGQMAIKAGLSRATMYSWVGHGVTPMASTLYDVGLRLGIPLADLYAAAGIPMPEVPSPRREYVAGMRESRAQLFDRMVENMADALREQGFGEAAIQQVVAHVRARQYPERPSLEGNVLSEFAESSMPAAGATEAGEQAPPPASGRSGHSPQPPGAAGEPVNGGRR
jgi:hypothetical protein